nr:beta-fructofuranosidase, insoluble isoenzyme 1-like [Ipomoea batatas]
MGLSSQKLGWVFLLCFVVFCGYKNGVVEASHKVYMHLQSQSAVDIKKVHRTGYHFQPPQHWPNLETGPMYYKGLYHLFYQYNPKGAVWGNIVWAHSVSKDMINWKPLKPAIYPSKSFDQFGTWSGSATILPGNKPAILYTGIVDDKQTQVQNLAYPKDYNDPYLQEWVKPDFNPIAIGDTPWVNTSAFRDPTTAWLGRDGHWRMLVGSKKRRRGLVYLYRSKDFVDWVKAKHPLHTAPQTGMWECPDFFPVQAQGKTGLDTSVIGENVKHVLKVSLDETRYEYYTVGTYYPDKDRFIPDSNSVDGWAGLRYDYGNFYASKTFFDPSKNRRVLWGWSNESDVSPDDSEIKGWSGIQAIPRKIWLHSNGKQVMQWPIEELEAIRENKVELNNHKLKIGEKIEVKGITAAQADVEVTFSFKSLDKAESFDPSWANYDAQKLCSVRGSTIQGGLGPFGLATLASTKLEEFTPVFFRVFKDQDKYKVLMCSDATLSTVRNKPRMYKPSFAGFVDVDLTVEKKLSLRSLIDHSVVESFGAGGKTCITSRVYPTLAIYDSAHLFAFNNGTEAITIETLNAWSMDNPKMN